MKTRLIALLVTTVLILFNVTLIDAESRLQIMPPLPADLLFTTTTAMEEVDYPRNMIVRVNAETLDVSPFYVDNEADTIMPLSWSPQGDLLAIYRIMPAIDEDYTLFPHQLCILNRAGVLQRCLNDNPPMHFAGDPQLLQHYYPVAWGPDGQTIYFYTEYSNSNSTYGYGRRLIEASVITGETLRVVFDYPDPYPINPSPDLNHAVVGFGGEWRGPGTPVFLVDLAANEQLDVTTAIPNNTEFRRGCLPFSPNGTYITVIAKYDLATYAPEQDPTMNGGKGNLLVILDTQGIIQGIIGQPNGLNTLWNQGCPAWRPDEQAFYFIASDMEKVYVMHYSLPDQRLTTLYELKRWPEQESNIYPPLISSSDGTYLAFTVSDGPYQDRLVAVLYPDGEIRRIPSPYRFGLYPLWMPAEEEPAPTPFNDDFESGTSNWTYAAGWLRINTLSHSPTWAMQAVRTVTTPQSCDQLASSYAAESCRSLAFLKGINCCLLVKQPFRLSDNIIFV